jgi:hypothetical protein
MPKPVESVSANTVSCSFIQSVAVNQPAVSGIRQLRTVAMLGYHRKIRRKREAFMRLEKLDGTRSVAHYKLIVSHSHS